MAVVIDHHTDTAVEETPPPSADARDTDLVAAVLRGREDAVTVLVARYHRALMRLARHYVRDAALAEDVVQDTWIAVLRGVERFEGRAPFRTWLFRVLANRARTRAIREARYLQLEPADDADPTADPFDRHGAWREPPRAWRITPERLALSGEVRRTLLAALDELPAGQRAVVELRDVQGFDAADVCSILGVSEANQRVLLHRGRLRLRLALTERLGS